MLCFNLYHVIIFVCKYECLPKKLGSMEKAQRKDVVGNCSSSHPCVAACNIHFFQGFRFS